MKHLPRIASNDVQTLVKKDASYGGSWKKRGGIGAFMMMARKWDRIETQTEKRGYDIFGAIEASQGPEGLLDDIRDLRCYLLLIEDHIMEQNAACEPQAPSDAVNDAPRQFANKASAMIEPLKGQALYDAMAVGGTCNQDAYDGMPEECRERMVKAELDRWMKVGNVDLVREIRKMRGLQAIIGNWVKRYADSDDPLVMTHEAWGEFVEQVQRYL